MLNQVSRRDSLIQLADTRWDLLIVGGGISGAGILLEARKNGLKAALVEQQDFAWGTSSRSSKMVHGGIKYLAQGQPIVTIKSVKERQKLLDQLPGLVDKLDLNFVNYKSNRLDRAVLRAGLFAYDILAGGLRRHYVSRKALLQDAPSLRSEALDCSYTFFESVTDDARLALRVLQEGLSKGGVAVNYCRAGALRFDGDKIAGVTLEDVETGDTFDVDAKMVINATGAWADKLREPVRDSEEKRIRPLRGSHLIFRKDRLPLGLNVSFAHPEDKRPVFAIEWEGRVMAGSTDLDHSADLQQEATVSTEEVSYILDYLNHYFPDVKLTRADILSSWSGVRPVVDTGATDPGKESRDHVLILEKGLLTITGGKLTTFRTMAEEVVHRASDYLGVAFSSNPNAFPAASKVEVDLPLSKSALQRMLGRYGPAVIPFLQGCTRDELRPIEDTQTLWAELIWALRHEQVLHLDDLLLRRTRIGLLLEGGAETILTELKLICRTELGWSEATWTEEVDRYREIWRRYYSVPIEGPAMAST